jgi:hypothetical protein
LDAPADIFKKHASLQRTYKTARKTMKQSQQARYYYLQQPSHLPSNEYLLHCKKKNGACKFLLFAGPDGHLGRSVHHPAS